MMGMASAALAASGSRDSLEGQFRDPPSAFRPVIITHGWKLKDRRLPDWLGERRAGGVVLDVTTSKGKGPEDWTDPTCLDNPAAFAQLREMMRRLKTAGKEVWLYDELGYPSGNAGGRVLEGHPDYAVSAVRCDELPDAFARKKGYPIARALPALFNDVGPATARHRHDFYDVYSDLIAENYFGQIQDWCRRHGVPSSGHMLLEESLLFFPMFNGSMTKNWARQDLPGVDLLWLPRYKTMRGWEGGAGIPVKEDFSCKLAASVSALMGKRGVFTESFALADRAKGQDLARRARGIAAWQFACGVTHMSTYSLQRVLCAADYAGFADFAGRLALLCRRGEPVSDVAVLVPEASVWAFYNPPAAVRAHRSPTRGEPRNPDAGQPERDTCGRCAPVRIRRRRVGLGPGNRSCFRRGCKEQGRTAHRGHSG